MRLGTLEEIIDDTHAIINVNDGEHYVQVLSIVDRTLLVVGATVLLHYQV
jgi:ATP-dependent 26S proteasome regulatory subunit